MPRLKNISKGDYRCSSRQKERCEMTIGRKLSRTQSLFVLAFTYVLVFFLGWSCLEQMPDLHPLVAMLITDCICTLVVFAVSLGMNNSSIYDPYWSVIPIFTVFWWCLQYSHQAPKLRLFLLLAVILLWGIRLTWNFLVSWPGVNHEDWRYMEFRRRFGRLYWLASLFGIHFVPTLLVFLGLIPAWIALESTAPASWLDAVAGLCGGMAILIQGTSDHQLRDHRASKPSAGVILESGLWKYSRHPNYFGEVLLWWSVWLFGVSAAPEVWWSICGPLAISGLFVFSSVPWTDRKSGETRPRYQEYMKRVNGLVPWFPRTKT
jgi:steroid 5-alpha reductase family enzyme